MTSWTRRVAIDSQLTFLMQTLLLIASITIAGYAGTSNLFTAYLAGAIISCSNAEKDATGQAGGRDLTAPVPFALSTFGSNNSIGQRPDPARSSPKSQEKVENMTMGQHQKKRNFTGSEIHAGFFDIPIRRVLKPFFFVSCPRFQGALLPCFLTLLSVSPFRIWRIISGSIVWRGLIYPTLIIL